MQDDGGVQDAGGNVLDDWGRRGELCRTMGGWEGAGRLGGGAVQDGGGGAG